MLSTLSFYVVVNNITIYIYIYIYIYKLSDLKHVANILKKPTMVCTVYQDLIDMPGANP